MRTVLVRQPRPSNGHVPLMVAICVTILAGCSADSPSPATPPTAATGDVDITEVAELTITLTADDSVAPLGEPIDLTVTLTNPGQRSVSAPVELRLATPDGSDVGIRRTTVFVPFGESVSERFSVTTSRWSDATGTFRVRAEIGEGAGQEAVASGETTAVLEIHQTDRPIPRFEDVTAFAGVATTTPEPDCGQFANGAAWGDVDGDGWQDLVVTRLGTPVDLFVNDTDGTFTRQSDRLGAEISGANGASFADYDNDGDPDLLLVGDGPNRLLRNDGTGRFTDVTAAASVAGDPNVRSMSAAWADFDGDGFLDLYVANYMSCSGPWTTEQEIIANVEYHPGVLYRNDRDGGFADVTDALPDADRTAAAFSAAWLHADDDGRPDLYVANDFVGLSPDHNRLWLNAGALGAEWVFTDASLDSGAGLYMNTMGVGIGDLDRDGDDDLALSNIGGNKLLRNVGDGTFAEQAGTGIERPEQDIDQLTVTWGTIVADFDLDGWLDVFFAAGNLPQAPGAVIGDQANMLFLNDGTGDRFLDVSALTGTDATGESKGVAAADYDNDGDIDLFVVDQDGRSHLYRNTTERSARHWLGVDLIGSTSNRDACGARVRVIARGVGYDRTVLCGSGGTGSSNARRLHFGLGDASTIESMSIDWPSGTSNNLVDVAADQVVRVVEPDA